MWNFVVHRVTIQADTVAMCKQKSKKNSVKSALTSSLSEPGKLADQASRMGEAPANVWGLEVALEDVPVHPGTCMISAVWGEMNEHFILLDISGIIVPILKHFTYLCYIDLLFKGTLIWRVVPYSVKEQWDASQTCFFSILLQYYNYKAFKIVWFVPTFVEQNIKQPYGWLWWISIRIIEKHLK